MLNETAEDYTSELQSPDHLVRPLPLAMKSCTVSPANALSPARFTVTVRSVSWVRAPLLRFFFNDTATTEIYTLSLHDALPISSITVNVFETALWLPAASVIRAVRS